MLKRLLAAALLALILYSAVGCGLLTTERISTTRMRVELFGRAYVLELDRIYELFERITSGSRLWLEVLPSYVLRTVERLRFGLTELLEGMLDDGYIPSCEICLAVTQPTAKGR